MGVQKFRPVAWSLALENTIRAMITFFDTVMTCKLCDDQKCIHESLNSHLGATWSFMNKSNVNKNALLVSMGIIYVTTCHLA